LNILGLTVPALIAAVLRHRPVHHLAAAQGQERSIASGGTESPPPTVAWSGAIDRVQN
jgi:hypothetical protein